MPKIVGWVEGMSAEDVKESLIHHENANPSIIVRRDKYKN